MLHMTYLHLLVPVQLPPPRWEVEELVEVEYRA
jgi:hypothetical protein